MAYYLKKILAPVIEDLASQFALPTKSGPGIIVSRINAKKNRVLKKAVVEAMGIHRDSIVLEIGYGRGDGIKFVFDKIKNGNGMVYGTEISRYLESITANRFALEIREEKTIRLDRVVDLRYLPYPNDFFDGIFHVDSYYFWGPRLIDILIEIRRVLKPGGSLVTALQLSRLRKLHKWNIINEKQFNPAFYLLSLEPAGFKDIKMEYFEHPNSIFEMISTRKCLDSEEISDPDLKMKQLENLIKTDMLAMRLLEERHPVYDHREISVIDSDTDARSMK